MNKQDIITILTHEHGLHGATAIRAVDGMIKCIVNALGNGDSVTLRGLGTFTTADREARQGRNPYSGETIDIPERRAVKFRPSLDLKNAVNNR